MDQSYTHRSWKTALADTARSTLNNTEVLPSYSNTNSDGMAVFTRAKNIRKWIGYKYRGYKRSINMEKILLILLFLCAVALVVVCIKFNQLIQWQSAVKSMTEKVGKIKKIHSGGFIGEVIRELNDMIAVWMPSWPVLVCIGAGIIALSAITVMWIEDESIGFVDAFMSLTWSDVLSVPAQIYIMLKMSFVRKSHKRTM